MFRRFKNFIGKLLSSRKYFDIPWIYGVQVYFYNKMVGNKTGVFKIKRISDLLPEAKILDGYKYRSKTQHNIEITVPDLNLYIIKDAVINSRSSAIIKGNNIYYEAINHNERFNEGFVKYHSNKYALVDLNTVEYIDEGFFLAGNGSYNWYHWILEILPKMMYFNNKRTNVILVDESCKTIPTMNESFRVFTEHLNVKIIYLDKSKVYKVKRLYFINEVNKLIYNVLKQEESSMPLYYFRKGSLINLSSVLKQSINTEVKEYKKIYLERKNTHRIPKNEQQIYNYLKEKDFSVLNIGDLTFNNQMIYFSNANEIIGTSGAAWTNLIFCKENCRAVMFMPDNFKNYRFFEEIADLLNVRFSYFYYDNQNQGHSDNNFEINIESLNKLITT